MEDRTPSGLHLLPGLGAAVIAASLALGGLWPASARGQEAAAALDQARYFDLCLGDSQTAIGLYQQALRASPSPRTLGEVLLTTTGEPSMRAMIVFVPRIPQRLRQPYEVTGGD